MSTFPTPIHPSEKRRPKYGNRKTVRGGLKFDSKKEAGRWDQLLMMEKAGEIIDLRRQVRYEIVFNGVKICDYVADFTYVERDARIVEDVKGMKTAVYRLKNKMMKACWGIDVKEV